MTFESFFHSYIETALWSSTGDNDEPLDRDFSASDIAKETIDIMSRDCKAFYNANYDAITGSDGMAGHDFWLTRNGHGAGFWDGDWPEPQASQLTDASKAFGEVWLYVGDDNQIYQV